MDKKKRDDFDRKVIDALSKRASYICSNPECRCLTIAATKLDEEKFTYIGVAAHITAAAEGGPRYNKNFTCAERGSIENGIFLCGSCSVMIDKNNGLDYSSELLKKWKDEHHRWVQENLNKKILNSSETIVNVTSNYQSGGLTAAVVNIQHASNYVQPSQELNLLISKNLSHLIELYANRIPKIYIEIESGNSKRTKVASDLVRLLSPVGAQFSQGTFLGRHPDDPITVLGNSSNIPFFKDLQKNISPYIDSFWRYPIIETFNDDILKIYINGEPSFNESGQVKIE